MDTIKFVIEQFVDEEAGYRFPVINIYINGQDLVDLVSRVEQKNWDGNKNTRSSYIGFEVDQFHQFHDEMLGKKRRPFSVVLTCTCTYAECNCIMVNMAFDTHTVTWSDMKSPWLSGKTPSPWIDEVEAQELDWHPLSYAGLGPFTFEHKQYLSALEEITEEWSNHKA
jgi:hypothetical protein